MYFSMPSLLLQPGILVFLRGKTFFLINFTLQFILNPQKYIREILLKHSPLHKGKAQLLSETKFLVHFVELGIVSQ